MEKEALFSFILKPTKNKASIVGYSTKATLLSSGLMNNVTLFSFSSDWIKITIEAYFDAHENLVIEGYDVGKRVEEAWGDSDYEYAVTIPSAEMNKLYSLFSLTPGIKKELLNYLQTHYNSNTCYSEIRSLLEKHCIKHEGFSWT
jgi:hypothetical protein